MKKIKTPTRETGSDILKEFVVKEKNGKTIFKLPKEISALLKDLSKEKTMTIRAILDGLANVAEKAHNNNALPELNEMENGERKSYTISEKAKRIFENIAIARKVSRDIVVMSALLYLRNEMEKNSRTPQQKIKHIDKMMCGIEKITEILNKEIYPNYDVLQATRDEDFSYCAELVGYVAQIYELQTALEEFKKEKENETHNTRA